MLFTIIVCFLFVCFDIQNNICTPNAVNLYFSGNAMNNLSSYCGLTDSRMKASEKYLPVNTCQMKGSVSVFIFIHNGISVFFDQFLDYINSAMYGSHVHWGLFIFIFSVNGGSCVNEYFDSFQMALFKGRLISKGLFGFFDSPKKRTKNFCPSTQAMAKINIFKFVFWEN